MMLYNTFNNPAVEQLDRSSRGLQYRKLHVCLFTLCFVYVDDFCQTRFRYRVFKCAQRYFAVFNQECGNHMSKGQNVL